MPQGKVSILLLGRSGTGKTTCCLYRLWNQFQAYWMLAKSINFEQCMPQRQLAILHNAEKIDYNDSETLLEGKVPPGIVSIKYALDKVRIEVFSAPSWSEH